ncbi:MAG: tannase/feruloyl esterase family alpha/beta hydrolase, partial [Bacteroidota bacterium]
LQFAFGTELFKYIFFDDPDWAYAAYDFDNWESDTRAGGAILDATDPDLTHFNVAGGKIIYWSGWTDAALTALGIIDYFEDVQKQNTHATDFTRLFLMPGVHHCGGGPGPDAADWLTAIQAWVEENRAPDTLLATKRQQGKVIMQRPLCAYPARAVFLGEGDGTEPDQFRCETP